MTENNNIPEHWEIRKLEEVCDKVSLNGIKIKQKDYLAVGKFPVIDQGQEIIGGYFNDEKLVIPTEPPYIIFGDHTKVKKFINFKFIAGADGVKVLKPHAIYDPKFFFYLIHTVNIPDKGYARHFQFLEKEVIPLPPLPEQQAIVSKIEELLSALENGKQQLQTARQQLKVYRQSLLKWAFEGKLTRLNHDPSDLHDEHDLNMAAESQIEYIKNQGSDNLPEGWKWVTINDIGKIKGGKRLPPKHQYSKESTEYIYIMAGNLKEGTVKNKPTYIQEETYNVLSNYKVTGGEVYITIVGACIGDAGVIPENIGKSILTENAAKIIKLKKIQNKYLALWINSLCCQIQIKGKILSATLGKLALNRIGTIEVPLPPIEEQQLIVQELESKLTVCDKIEETIGYSLQQAETLWQSILKKAFEGRLV